MKLGVQAMPDVLVKLREIGTSIVAGSNNDYLVGGRTKRGCKDGRLGVIGWQLMYNTCMAAWVNKAS
eukprot:SAG22_NODE_1023_length_5990_cov_16.923782_6_plen_67_part_00